MASLYMLIPIAIIFVIIAVAIFLWAVKSDQYDDLERQGSNILFEEDEETTSNNKNECHSDNKNKDC
ncbi:cbb3-type cytochrome oxidase assembly protein CcoS [Photobacterium damselae]|uniref:cbb3-type cytochrome oxidase assembly protein CcoS n=1 Tax=Photobacterium damselae TaxID=38293 RepID=UPI001EDD46AB|nr:cbb3-type cytochrome oxidase assembly protein CcoS [Photobacterium damselae]MCG3814902.1 cbb3-type cytochrome oxidase assembly protein CcoS [Photobacterium damselae]